MSLSDQIIEATDRLVSLWKTRDSISEGTDRWHELDDQCHSQIYVVNDLLKKNGQDAYTKEELRLLYGARVGAPGRHF